MDVNILKRFRESDDDAAFKLIYDAYYSKIFSYIFSFTKNEDHTQDILQLSFIKLWIHRAELDTDRALDAYLFTIAKNQVLDFFRGIKNNELLKKQYAMRLSEGAYTFIDDLFKNELYAKIEKYIQKLPKQQAKIFKLNKLDGYSIEEIAQEFGLSKQTVKNHLTEAKKNLRSDLTKENLIMTLLFWYFF